MKHQLHLFAFCLVWAFQVRAQEPSVYNFSLNEAIDYAQKHQNAILNAQIDENIAKNTVKQTIGIGLPQVSGSYSFQDYIDIPTVIIPASFFGKPGDPDIRAKFGTKYQSSVGADISQLLFDGSYIVGIQASKTYKELSVRNLKRTRIETAVGVTKAYYSVLVNNEQLTLIDANLVRLRKSLEDTEALFQNGLVEKIDVDRLSVLKNNLETERENVVRLLELNNNLLKFQMGMPIQMQLTLKETISSLQMQPVTMVSDTVVYQNRIEYGLLQTRKKLNELDLKRYKSQFLPSAVAFGNVSRSFMSDDFSTIFSNNFPVTSVGLKVSLPIISGGQRLYHVRNAKLEVLKSENDIHDLKNAINLEVSMAQTKYTNGIQSLENQKRNMKLAKEVLDVSRIKYEQGVGSSLEVTTAETSSKEAENNYINALYDMLINKVNLDKALGKINY
jgi:outer membrane protein TolC